MNAAAQILALATAAVESLVEETLGDDLDVVTFEACQEVADATGLHVGSVVGLVKGYGLRVGPRAVPREVRGYRSNSHDRWFGKGSCPTHGGSGWEQISGFAGQKG